MKTPWGPSQFVEQVAPGVTFHSTASHGGYLVTPERAATLTPAARKHATFHTPAGYWYEEDCDAAILAHAADLAPDRAEEIAASLARWNPEYLAAVA